MAVLATCAGAHPRRDVLNSGGEGACRLAGTAGYCVRIRGQKATARIRRCWHPRILPIFDGKTQFSWQPSVEAGYRARVERRVTVRSNGEASARMKQYMCRIASASRTQPPTGNLQQADCSVSAAQHASAVAPASGHLLHASACPPWSHPHKQHGARRRAEEGPLWGSDPEDAHGIGIHTTRPRSAPRSHPASGPLLHVPPIPAPRSGARL